MQWIRGRLKKLAVALQLPLNNLGGKPSPAYEKTCVAVQGKILGLLEISEKGLTKRQLLQKSPSLMVAVGVLQQQLDVLVSSKLVAKDPALGILRGDRYYESPVRREIRLSIEGSKR